MMIDSRSRLFARLLLALIAMSYVTRNGRADDAPAVGQAPLKWTPHRAAAAPGRTALAESTASPASSPQATTTPPRLQEVPSAGATRVELPDGVPAAAAPRRAFGEATGAGTGARRPAPGPARRSTPAPAATARMPAVDIFRTPTRGAAARPILADESPAGTRIERLGGRPAPRGAAGGRPERQTAGIDTLPSVMRQAPQDPGVPTRTEADNPPEAIPAPMPQDSSAPGQEMPPGDIQFGDEIVEGGADMMGGPDGLMLGDYPTELHVESFYDDPYACEDEDPMCHHSGRICAWLRQFGRPYYGWRWYRDFTAGAGVIGFTNAADLGLGGNFGVDEFVNQGMPLWNAFGVGWQVGARGTQTNFQSSTLGFPGGSLTRSSREQVFVTTGFFTRAFEGRGLQGGAVYDYLHDNWFDNTDVAQLRYEVSYVWGYHEVGFWGASNIGDQNGIFSPVRKTPGVASTLDLYTAFYRLQFGDANEWKVWGGGTGYGDGVVGSIVRAPMSRSWGLEGFFTYVIPGGSQTIDIDGRGTTYSYSPAAWNVGVNVVFYPGGRSRRGLASPYRPLFDVADNGTLIRRLGIVAP